MKGFKGKINNIQKIYIKMHGNIYITVHNYKFTILYIYAKFQTILTTIQTIYQTIIHYLFIFIFKFTNVFSLHKTKQITKI